MKLFIKIMAITAFATYLTIAIFAITRHALIPSVPVAINQFQTINKNAAKISKTNLPSDGKLEVKTSNLEGLLRKLIPSRSIKPVPMSGQSQFAFDLYQAIRAQSGNLIYSPYSISTALAMAYVGAKGNTEQQMSKILHFPFPQDRQHPAVNIADLELSDSNRDDRASSFKLKVANSLWGQKDYSFQPDFLDTLAKNFDTELQLVDFKNAAGRQQASSAINQWVSQSTEGMINKLISDQDLTANTRLILANAIYFKAEWAEKFKLDPPDVKFKFTLLDGNTVTFPRMSIFKSLKYTKGEEYEAVVLPYKDRRMSMVIVLPAKGKFEAIEKQFNAQFVGQLLGSLFPERVDLYMPKFKYEAQLRLTDTLAKMGMPDAFDNIQADFSGISDMALYISDVIHKAVIAVDETGTEASAATQVTSGIACGGPVSPPVYMRINRPFLYFIRDTESSEVLFIGRVLNPLVG